MKKPLLILLILSVLGAIGWLFLKSYKGIHAKKKAAQQVQTLPAAAFLSLDSTFVPIKNTQRPTAIFYFDPHCEHCQQEAATLVKEAQQFKDVQVYWLSSASLADLRTFEVQYGLQKKLSMLQIGQISAEVADKQFGFRTVPTILLYNQAGTLTKKYVGETKTEAILKYLR